MSREHGDDLRAGAKCRIEEVDPYAVSCCLTEEALYYW